MINPSFAFELFSSWLAIEMFMPEFYEFLYQLDTEEEHY